MMSLTIAVTAAFTAGAYRALLAIGRNGPPGSMRAKMVQILGGGGGGPVPVKPN